MVGATASPNAPSATAETTASSPGFILLMRTFSTLRHAAAGPRRF